MTDIIKKEKISDQVCRYIQDRILYGEYRDGERIVETKIAKDLGVSQSPVREALKELEVMGLVEIIPYTGSVVRSVNERELKQIYELRGVIESFAARNGMENVKDDDVRQMESIIDKMRAVAKENDKEKLSEYDLKLHSIIISRANNPYIMKMWTLVGASQWTNITIGRHKDPNYFPDSHLDMLESLRNRDVDRYCNALTTHFENAAKIVTTEILQR